MVDPCKPEWANLSASAILTARPCYLCCAIFSATDSGDYIDVYEGRDATSGRKIFRIKGLQYRSVAFNFGKPVYCQRGLYVEFSTDDTEATVVWVDADQDLVTEE